MPGSAHEISLADAVVLTTRARNANLLPVHAWLFRRDILDMILAQDGVHGMRMYLGQDIDGVPHLVLVGTDSTDQDMTAGILGEWDLPCPPYCSDGSVLHTGV